MLLLHNFHKFLGNPAVSQTAFAQLVAGKQRAFVVVLAPVVQIPVELEMLFVVIEHALPDRGQLERVARELTADQPEDQPRGEDRARVLDAAAGLTRYEAEGAFALSLTRHNALRPEAVWELKARALKKTNLLTLHRGGERFDGLGGLANLKDFCRRALRPGRSVKPRGILLLGSLVGQSEANLRQELRIADAMGPALLFVDEVEKALGGTGDSGVATRLFGTLLTWLSDHASDVFFVGTSNDISKLPPEFARAERFDGVFFLDLPTAQERAMIGALYRSQYGIPAGQARPDDAAWTGAEVKSCCRLAALLDVPLADAAQHVVPVAVTAAEQVERLRAWASGRCLSASAPGVYRRDGAPPPGPGRRVRRGPENN